MEYVPEIFTQKLILLFAMEKMEIPLTENSVIDLCTNSNRWLTYMDLKQVLFDLTNIGFILKIVDSDGESRFSLTESGKNCISLFYQKIPLSIRDNIIEFSKLNSSHYKRRQEYVGQYIKNPDGSYYVILKIKDSLKLTVEFEVKLKFPNRTSAINAVDIWRKKAPDLFMLLYEALN